MKRIQTILSVECCSGTVYFLRDDIQDIYGRFKLYPEMWYQTMHCNVCERPLFSMDRHGNVFPISRKPILNVGRSD